MNRYGRIGNHGGIAMRNAVLLVGVAVLCLTGVARAEAAAKPCPYVGRVMMEIVVFFPKEFDQMDEKVKADIKESMMKTGAQESENGELKMPMKPLVGAWLKTGKQTIMVDMNGDFTVPSLPADVTEIPIFQQLTDKVPLAKFPVKRLVHAGDKVEPFVITTRTPFGECHSGKVDHTN